MPAVLVLIALAVGGLASGCGNHSALCLETEIAVNDAIQRCDPSAPYSQIGFMDRPEIAACQYVNRVDNASEITHQCLPWLASVSCAELFSSSELPDYCDYSHFVFVYTGEFPEPEPDPEL
jgi:hypothetical protein